MAHAATTASKSDVVVTCQYNVRVFGRLMKKVDGLTQLVQKQSNSIVGLPFSESRDKQQQVTLSGV